MSTMTLGTTEVDLNEEGFFVHPEQWTEAMAPELARHEGLRTGPSSGLIFEGARRTALKAPVGCGVMIFCDDVFKYASNMLKHVPGLEAEP